MKDWLFILFGSWSIASGLGVVFSRNPVYSAFSLIMGFFGLATLYLLWDATFIAMIQILIYTGAIVVLFVFVVMLLNLGWSNALTLSHRWMGLFFSAAGVWVFSLVVLRVLNRGLFLPPAKDNPGFDLKTVSKLLFNEYLWPFEVLSIFLLALIIAIYALTRPEKTERTV